MKTKFLFLAALAGMTLVSCTSEEYLGENNPSTSQDKLEAINFGSGFKAVTRAITGATAAGLLNSEMKVYGVKNTLVPTMVMYSLITP